MTLKNKMFIYLFHEFSLDECSFLTNILQWGLTKQEGEPFYKTDKEMMGECRITEWELRVSKEKFEKLGFFKTEKRNPMKFKTATPYIVNYKQFLELKNKDVIKKIQQKIQTVGLENPQVRTRESSPLDSRIPHIHIIDTVLTTDITTVPPISPAGENNILPFQKKIEEENTYNIYYGNSKKAEKEALPSPKKSLKNNRFDEWYAEYPRKDARGSAEKAWLKIKPEEIDQIIEKTKCYANLVKEKSTERQFIPLPASWLNSKRWMDEELKDFLPKPPQKTEEERKIATLKEIWFEEFGTMEGFKYGTI